MSGETRVAVLVAAAAFAPTLVEATALTAPAAALMLWELNAAAETDTGFHCGADVGMLSQFKHEQEGARRPLPAPMACKIIARIAGRILVACRFSPFSRRRCCEKSS